MKVLGLLATAALALGAWAAKRSHALPAAPAGAGAVLDDAFAPLSPSARAWRVYASIASMRVERAE